MSDWLKLLILAFQVGFSVFQYFTASAAAKEAARQAMANLFLQVENMGYPIITDVLARTSRGSWIPWQNIPVTPMDEEK